MQCYFSQAIEILNSGAVVGNDDGLLPVVVKEHSDLCCCRIDGIVEEFLGAIGK